MPTDKSTTTPTATIPALPPTITRLQTPPISELSNAGSTIARKDQLSELSSSVMDISDAEETAYSASPTNNRSRPTVTVPAAPLTKSNLVKHQEEITSAVEVASAEESLHLPATLNTRLAQARNFLLTENANSYHGFAARLEEIEDYLQNIPREQVKLLPGIYNEVKRLLRGHRIHIVAGGEPPNQRRAPITAAAAAAAKGASRPLMSLPADDDDDDDQPDPFEWTNKLDNLTLRVKQSPSGNKAAFAATHLRELARPLNAGLLPSAEEAHRLINEQMIKENHENKPDNVINHTQLRSFEPNLPPASTNAKFSLDRWSGHPTDGERVAELRLGEGTLMPQEMRDFDWERDRDKLVDGRGEFAPVDEEEAEAQLFFAETPLLQAVLSEQIESDLAHSEYSVALVNQLRRGGVNADVIAFCAAGVKKGRDKAAPVARKRAVLTTRKFALPRPQREGIEKAAEIAKSLNIPPDPPTPSPRTALVRKRLFERGFDSDSDAEDERGGKRRVDRTVRYQPVARFHPRFEPSIFLTFKALH
ncbi:MAG: hypothetical protein ASARMPRED_005370 [Alectoria sarmentosa]|nr:MAG: hypothetical protein ASARMPRED_005370 [Alectoria sarmentosa]